MDAMEMSHLKRVILMRQGICQVCEHSMLECIASCYMLVCSQSFTAIGFANDTDHAVVTAERRD